MRESEIIGLTWDEIDWENDSIHLQHQLVRTKEKNSRHIFTTLKNKQSRTFTMAPSVVNMLNSHAPEGTTINETKGSERKREVVE